MFLSLLSVFFIALFGAFLQTNIGFGFPILAMIFLPYLFPFASAVTLCQLIAIPSTIYLSIRYWKSIRWRILLPLLTVSLVTGAIITFYSFSMDQSLLKMILGIVLVVLSCFFIWFSNRIQVRATYVSASLMGAIGGVGNGLFGIGGPPVALYLMAAIDDPKQYLATIQCYFFLSNISTIIIRLGNGSLTWSESPFVLIGWLGIGIGTWVGLYTFKKIPVSRLKKLVYGFVGASGAWIVFSELFFR